jgi:hypothetical protein
MVRRMKHSESLLAGVLLLTMSACAGSHAATASPASPAAAQGRPAIAQADVEAAQAAWCDALVSIGAASAKGQDPKALATEILSTAYAYDTDPVLFKPTLTFGAQTFRFDKQGALAYFVGGDPAYPDDSGFALKGWTSCRPEIRNWYTDGDVAIAMGNVYLEDAKGTKVMVDKTFGYHRNAQGNLQIVLHHSSLPFTPAPK